MVDGVIGNDKVSFFSKGGYGAALTRGRITVGDGSFRTHEGGDRILNLDVGHHRAIETARAAGSTPIPFIMKGRICN
jgi:hypothetical protein